MAPPEANEATGLEPRSSAPSAGFGLFEGISEKGIETLGAGITRASGPSFEGVRTETDTHKGANSEIEASGAHSPCPSRHPSVEG